MADGIKRREFLGVATAAAAGAGLAGCAGTAAPAAQDVQTGPADTALTPPRAKGQQSMRNAPFRTGGRARIAIVGTGLRGRSVLAELLTIEGAEITAIADLRNANADLALQDIAAAGRPTPAVYAGGERDFERLVERDDIDLVYTATPWEWHVPVCLAALAAGKHAATECPAGITLEDLWALVDASERNQRHCLQLENCNYGYNEMLVNRLVHAGVLGEVLHCEAAYLHDLQHRHAHPRHQSGARARRGEQLGLVVLPAHGHGLGLRGGVRGGSVGGSACGGCQRCFASMAQRLRAAFRRESSASLGGGDGACLGHAFNALKYVLATAEA